MPLINMPLDTLLRLVNTDGEIINKSDVADRLHDMGLEVEEITNTQQYECGVCGKITERTEAQGAPLDCSNCGSDFRQSPDDLWSFTPSRGPLSLVKMSSVLSATPKSSRVFIILPRLQSTSTT